MLRLTAIFLIASVVLSGCTKCVECEIRLKQSQDVIGYVDEFCGTNKKVEEEEERLLADYTCVECSVNTGLGTTTSGVHCGDREFTDSLERAWDEAGFAIGQDANCVYYRDTANVTCLLKQ